MNIDLTIVHKDSIISLSSDKPITPSYIISLLKKRKVLKHNDSFMLLDFYTGESFDLIIESGKLMLLPDIQFKQQSKTAEKKQMPIEQLIQKATKAERPLIVKKNKANTKVEAETEPQYSLYEIIEERDDVIEVSIDRNQLKGIMQRFEELGIELGSLNSSGQSYSNTTETNSPIRQDMEQAVQESITNYLYSAIKSNETILKHFEL